MKYDIQREVGIPTSLLYVHIYKYILLEQYKENSHDYKEYVNTRINTLQQ